jgi:hypothetical protein
MYLHCSELYSIFSHTQIIVAISFALYLLRYSRLCVKAHIFLKEKGIKSRD